MRRFEVDGRVVYVERRRGLSLLLLAAAVAALAGAAIQGLKEPETLLMMGASFGLGAFLVLLLERAVIIDRATGALRIVERSMTGSSRRSFPLEGLRVRVTSDEGGRSSWIWLEFPRTGRILFQGPLQGARRVSERVQALLRDCGA